MNTTNQPTSHRAKYDDLTGGWYFPNGFGAVPNDDGPGWVAVDPSGVPDEDLRAEAIIDAALAGLDTCVKCGAELEHADEITMCGECQARDLEP